MRLRGFVKAFFHAGDANIQDHAPAQNAFAGVFLQLFIIIITVRETLIQTSLDKQVYIPDSLINLEKADVLFCCFTNHQSHITYLKDIQEM